MHNKYLAGFKKPARRHNKKESDNNHPVRQDPLSKDLNINITRLRAAFEHCSDVVMREFKINMEEPINVFVLYVDGLTDQAMVSEHVLRAMQLNPGILPHLPSITKANAFAMVKERLLSIAEVNNTDDLAELIDFVLSGDIAILIDGSAQALVPSARGIKSRSVEEPVAEPVVQGPRDGFTEILRVNTTMIRRRIKTPRLKMESLRIG